MHRLAWAVCGMALAYSLYQAGMLPWYPQVKLREQQTFLLSATMPLTTCTEWAFSVQPSVPLAEIFKDAQQHRRLAEVLKVIEPVRYDHWCV